MNKHLKDKITALFDYRRLPWMMDAIRNEAGRTTFLDQLMELQTAIFEYDGELERSWELNHDRLEILWAGITEKLDVIIGSEMDAEGYLNQIQTYALNEMSLRSGLKMSALPIRYFYYYKSCDVRLMRRLIFERSDDTGFGHELSDWLVFDWVTEVNDDINDVFEDMYTFNGNRFLHGCRFRGIETTIGEYMHFLDYLEKKAEDLPVDDHSEKGMITSWTVDELRATRKDLDRMKGCEKLVKLTRGPAINDGIN